MQILPMWSSMYFHELLYIASIFIIVVYIILVVFFFLFLNLFDVRFIKTLNDLKNFGVLVPFNLFVSVLILSFAGLPPLFGFSIKLVVFVLLVQAGALFVVMLGSIFNFFTIYFYIQNLRYMLNNKKNNYFKYINHFVYLPEVLLFTLVSFFMFNLLGVFFLPELFVALYFFLF